MQTKTKLPPNVKNHFRWQLFFYSFPLSAFLIFKCLSDRREQSDDGYVGYLDVVYFGEHVRNISNKNDTFTVEGVNADLRHYIPILARKSKCFPRKIETLRAVLDVFAGAYNQFGEAKMNFRRNRDPKSRKLPFSVIDFL